MSPTFDRDTLDTARRSAQFVRTEYKALPTSRRTSNQTRTFDYCNHTLSAIKDMLAKISPYENPSADEISTIHDGLDSIASDLPDSMGKADQLTKEQFDNLDRLLSRIRLEQ